MLKKECNIVRANCFFQQDGAIHTVATTPHYLRHIFLDRVISRGLWPSRSPDLTTPNNFLFGHLKNNIFRNRPHSLDDSQDAIVREINSIGLQVLHNVFENFKRRVYICLKNNGLHFQYLL